MTQEKGFLKKLVTDPQAREMMKAAGEVAGDEARAEKLVEAAKKLGFDISKEKFLKLIKIKETAQKKRTQTAEAEVKTALDDRSMEAVAGGDSICGDTYIVGENCWMTDECNMVFRSYEEQPAVPVPEAEDCTGEYITYEGREGNEWAIALDKPGELGEWVYHPDQYEYVLNDIGHGIGLDD